MRKSGFRLEMGWLHSNHPRIMCKRVTTCLQWRHGDRKQSDGQSPIHTECFFHSVPRFWRWCFRKFPLLIDIYHSYLLPRQAPATNTGKRNKTLWQSWKTLCRWISAFLDLAFTHSLTKTCLQTTLPPSVLREMQWEKHKNWTSELGSNLKKDGIEVDPSCPLAATAI